MKSNHRTEECSTAGFEGLSPGLYQLSRLIHQSGDREKEESAALDGTTRFTLHDSGDKTRTCIQSDMAIYKIYVKKSWRQKRKKKKRTK